MIAADNFDSMFIWSSKTCSDDSSSFNHIRNVCEKHLLDEAKDRFPSPTMHFLKEGESMARRFSARLVPSHGDQEEDQMKNFSALHMLSEDELRRLRMKFRIYDPLSDASFLHWFAKVKYIDSMKWQQGGSSLCE